MAIIKSYTDLQQSKKLAEILPLESADMCINSTNPYMITHELRPYGGFDNEHDPCWSLSALLSIIPYPSLHKTFSGWRCDSHDREGCILGEPSDNQVDACYEMILKLHKLKML